MDEAKEGAQQAKWGMVSSQVGDELVLRIGGGSSSSMPAPEHNSSVVVGLGMLKSYQDVGAATVSCSGGCSCNPHHFQLLHDQQVSLPIDIQGVMALSCPAGKSCHVHPQARTGHHGCPLLCLPVLSLPARCQGL